MMGYNDGASGREEDATAEAADWEATVDCDVFDDMECTRRRPIADADDGETERPSGCALAPFVSFALMRMTPLAGAGAG